MVGQVEEAVIIHLLVLIATLTYQTEQMLGWEVNTRVELLAPDPTLVNEATRRLRIQLTKITERVPSLAVARLKRVKIWISPEYPGIRPRAEYHPAAAWLKENGRDPFMAKGVEFTNVRIFAAECNRMPWFVFHELAHAYHDQLPESAKSEIKSAYETAVKSGAYDNVVQWHGNGLPNTTGRAYAMTNEFEYFAESSEAFFGRNDFFPFNRNELRKVDTEMGRILDKLWGNDYVGRA